MGIFILPDMGILTSEALDGAGPGRTMAAMRGQYPNRIREWRKAARLTQAELAERLQTTNQNLSRYERGERSLTVDLLVQIAPALGCRPADLLPDGESVWDEQVHRLAEAFQRLSRDDRAALERMILALADKADEPDQPPLRRRLVRKRNSPYTKNIPPPPLYRGGSPATLTGATHAGGAGRRKRETRPMPPSILRFAPPHPPPAPCRTRPCCPAPPGVWGSGGVPLACLLCRLARLHPADRVHVVALAEAAAERPEKNPQGNPRNG